LLILNTKTYAEDSLVSGRATHAEQLLSEVPDRVALKFGGWAWGYNIQFSRNPGKTPKGHRRSKHIKFGSIERTNN
jgi:hypothetical protein